jgi:hypothetical protein
MGRLQEIFDKYSRYCCMCAHGAHDKTKPELKDACAHEHWHVFLFDMSDKDVQRLRKKLKES